MSKVDRLGPAQEVFFHLGKQEKEAARVVLKELYKLHSDPEGGIDSVVIVGEFTRQLIIEMECWEREHLGEGGK